MGYKEDDELVKGKKNAFVSGKMHNTKKSEVKVEETKVSEEQKIIEEQRNSEENSVHINISLNLSNIECKSDYKPTREEKLINEYGKEALEQAEKDAAIYSEAFKKNGKKAIKIVFGSIIGSILFLFIIASFSKTDEKKEVSKITESSTTKEQEVKNQKAEEKNIAKIAYKVVNGERVLYDESDKNMELNVEYIIKDNNGEYSLIIEGIRFTDYRNEFHKEEVKQVIFLDYKYTNISSKKDVYIGSYNIKLIDDKGNELKTYPASGESGKYAKSISVGKTQAVTEAYGMPNNSKNIKLIYNDGIPKEILGEWNIPTGL